MTDFNTCDTFGSVLVIGGCGLLGGNIISKLRDEGVAPVASLDFKVAKDPKNGVQYITGSTALNKIKPRVIFHTASSDPLGNDNELLKHLNFDGMRNFLEWVQKRTFVKAIVYTCNSSIIHDGYSDIKFATEDYRILYWPEQRVYYPHTKAPAEDSLLAADRIAGTHTVSIRPVGLFGPGDFTMTGNIMQNAREGRSKVQVGDNTNLFDLTYIDNHVDAQILAAEALLRSHVDPPPEHLKVAGEAIVITNDEPLPFWDFVRGIAAAGGYPVRDDQVWVLRPDATWIIAAIMEWAFWIFTFGCKEPTLTRSKIKYMTIHRTFNIDKAKKRLGYRPRIDMQEGIARTGKWCKAEGFRATRE